VLLEQTERESDSYSKTEFFYPIYFSNKVRNPLQTVLEEEKKESLQFRPGRQYSVNICTLAFNAESNSVMYMDSSTVMSYFQYQVQHKKLG